MPRGRRRQVTGILDNVVDAAVLAASAIASTSELAGRLSSRYCQVDASNHNRLYVCERQIPQHLVVAPLNLTIPLAGHCQVEPGKGRRGCQEPSGLWLSRA